MQETHRGIENINNKWNDASRKDPKNIYGSSIFTKPLVEVISLKMTEVDDIEVIMIALGKCIVTSVYKPSNILFKFHKPKNFAVQSARNFLGDINCHSMSWEYNDTNDDGHALDAWAVSEDLSLIHDHKLLPLFSSGRCKSGYNLDLIFISKTMDPMLQKDL